MQLPRFWPTVRHSVERASSSHSTFVLEDLLALVRVVFMTPRGARPRGVRKGGRCEFA